MAEDESLETMCVTLADGGSVTLSAEHLNTVCWSFGGGLEYCRNDGLDV